MPTFIEACNCKGIRPLGVIGKHYTSRPDIIGSLLKDRHVSRFIIAPSGFGKSNIVYEYASIIFAFQHVFWIKCDSPCFLRDLDAGSIFDSLMQCDPNVRLVIFEDLPTMDSDRSETMSNLIDELLESHCEVIATCTPSADSLSSYQRSRITVRAKALMLTDNELAIEELRGGLGEDWRDQIKSNERVACNIWGDSGSSRMLIGLRAEDLPQEMKLSILIMLIAQSGTTDALSKFISKDHVDEIVSVLEKDYPMLGVESRTKTFSALDVSIAQIAADFCCRLDDMSVASAYPDRDRLCAAMADLLCDGLKESRACEMMETFATKHGSAKWLTQKGWRLLIQMKPFACVHLHDVSRRGASGFYDALSTLKSWGSYMLGDADQAKKHARRLMRSTTSRFEEKVCASVLLCIAAEDVADDVALVEARSVLSDAALSKNEGMDSQSVFDALDWKGVARFSQLDSDESVRELKRAHKSLHGAKDDSAHSIDKDASTFFMDVVWLMRRSAFLCEHLQSEDSADKSGCIEDLAKDLSVDADALRKNPLSQDEILDVAKLAFDLAGSTKGRLSFFAVLAISAIEKTSHVIPALKAIAADPLFEDMLRQSRADLSAQREEYRKYVVAGLESKLDFQRANPDAFRLGEVKETKVVRKQSAPQLHISLFGGLKVKIGDALVDPKLLSRKKAKLLLAILVVNKGREVPRAKIMHMLWPTGNDQCHQRNFYSVWSQLKKALSVSGTCPYLVRTQSGYRLDERYLRSDLGRFDDLCRTLMFGPEQSVSWEVLYSQVSEEFSEELLPSLVDNDQINLLRDKCRESLVDGLVATSSRLNGLGEPRGALWFAREAIRRDDKREDAYIALMEAQISANQRGGALETYFSCRKFLSEDLGIDPSMKVIELYRSIIECEEEFA